jgi:hypothetical protein
MTDEETVDDAPKAKKKKAPAKKAAPKKAAAKPKKPAAKKPKPEDTQESAPVAALVDVVPEVIDAEIVAETVLDPEASETVDETATDAQIELTDEERELQAIYGEETAGTPATAHAEFQDRQTRDEDRPMMPEINAREERKAQWQERRDRRKQRRDERQQRREGGGGGQRHDQPRHEQRPPQQVQMPMPPRESRPELRMQAPINGTAGHDDGPLGRVGTPLGDAAAAVFQQLRNGQPLPVRQLAAMMRKRSLVNQDPEQLWPQLKAELLGDERSYRTLGLRPRIVYRGRDLFAPGPVAMSVTADAEAGVATALSRLAGATHRALSQRVAKASPAGFERLIHAYLVAAGYRDIDWIKRVGGIAYATATAPGLGRQVLISARSGDQPIDRRGIGELRVGVEAKDLVAGILFAARELSEDAEQELERAGRSISVMCGDLLVAGLIASGVGVVSSAAPVHYLDDQLLDELLAG